MAPMLRIRDMLSGGVRESTAGMSALNGRVDAFGDDIRKNGAGVAPAHAFPSFVLNRSESFRPRGGAGCFRGYAAVAFGFTGRPSRHGAASGGAVPGGACGGGIEIL